MDLTDFAYDLLGGLAYGGVGLVLMLAGFMIIDALTPGRLAHLIMVERRKDAGIVVASGFLSVGAIVASAIIASDGDLGEGLAESAGFGGVGLILLAVAYVAIDRFTPGDLGEILCDEHDDPAAAYVTGAALLGMGAIIAAAIS